MEDKSTSGTIELILGPMFSGKSTELLRRVRRFAAADNKTFVLSFKGDTRYGQAPQVVTHDKTCMKSKAVYCLQEVENEVWQYAVIAIDEGQFQPDLAIYAEKWANDGKTVIIAALDSTYLREPFDNIQAVVPLAESIVKLSAVCKSCLGEAAFTFRLGSETSTQLVGGSDKYEARCRACYRAGEALKAEGKGDSSMKRRKSGGKPSSRRQSWEALADATNLPSSLQSLNLR